MSKSMNHRYGLLFASCIAIGYVAGVSPVLSAASDDETPSSPAAQNVPPKLSVAPLDHVDYPAERPGWLNDPPQLDGATHTWVVVTPGCDSQEEADEMIGVLARAAVASYIEQQTGLATDQLDFPIEDRWVDERLVDKRYSGRYSEGDSPRFETAWKLSFSPSVQRQIQTTRENFEVRQRLGAMGLGVSGVLGMLFLGSGVLGVVSRRYQTRPTV